MDNFYRTDVKDFDDIASKDQYVRAINEGYSEKEALYFVNKRSRDNSRTPFHWNDNIQNAGFTSENVKPWIKMVGSHKEVNLENQINDENSIFNHYKNIIKLRQKSKYSDCLIYGKFIGIDFKNDNIIGYLRENEKTRIICLNNFSLENVEVKLDEVLRKFVQIEKVLVNNYSDLKVENGIIELEGHQSVLLKI